MKRKTLKHKGGIAEVDFPGIGLTRAAIWSDAADRKAGMSPEIMRVQASAFTDDYLRELIDQCQSCDAEARQ